MAVLQSVRAYVTAQRRYAADGHDGNQPGVYAVKFGSDPGKQNGLYWPTTQGQKRSPLGDLVAQAADGRTGGRRRHDEALAVPWLLFQNSHLAGRCRERWGEVIRRQGADVRRVRAGRLAGEYDVTGVMTFVVNQDGVVREKDLGPRPTLSRGR